ncbi:uncharacterized protein TNCV_2919051 [Trichonephila clavipes]|nr:uncharacterized protein TNCV_2919051 [Trichonephila clavipes]
MVQYEASSCKELGKVPSSLNSDSVSRDMANTPSYRKNFCCSVPLTTMRSPWPIWLNLPLTQNDRYSTGTLLGKGECTRRSCSWIAIRGDEPGMIHRDAHHLGIAAIAGNRGNGEFDGLTLVMKHVGMSKINGLTRHAAEKEGWLALYMLEDVRGHPMGQSFLMRAFHMCFQSPFPRLGTHHTPR